MAPRSTMKKRSRILGGRELLRVYRADNGSLDIQVFVTSTDDPELRARVYAAEDAISRAFYSEVPKRWRHLLNQPTKV
jgi:hypothetical protein